MLSFFVPKHRSPMGGAATAAPAGSWTFNVIADFLSGVSDNRELFEQWTIPVQVVAPSHPSQGVTREVKAAIRSGDVASSVVWYICQRMLKSSRVQLPKPGVAGSRSCYDFEINNKVTEDSSARHRSPSGRDISLWNDRILFLFLLSGGWSPRAILAQQVRHLPSIV